MLFFLGPLYSVLNVRICEYNIEMSGSLERESYSAAQVVKKAYIIDG